MFTRVPYGRLKINFSVASGSMTQSDCDYIDQYVGFIWSR